MKRLLSISAVMVIGASLGLAQSSRQPATATSGNANAAGTSGNTVGNSGKATGNPNDSAASPNTPTDAGNPDGATATSPYTRNEDESRGERHNFGWIGLLGLAGLAGLTKRRETSETARSLESRGVNVKTVSS